MTSKTPPDPLIGRAEEIQLLAAKLQDLGSGRGSIAVIHGEAGIGKTALLEHADRDARQRGFQVFRAGAHELERDRPFGPFIEALQLAQSSDPRRAEIADLLVDRKHADPAAAGMTIAPELRFRITEAIVELIQEYCADGPAVLAIEDLHWADGSTLLAIKRMIGLVAQLPLFVLCTARRFPRSSALDRVIETIPRDALQIDLQPLDDASLRSLVRRILGSEPGAGLERQVYATGGNPLFVTELLSTLVAEGAIEIRDARAEVAKGELPPSLQLTILRRLSFLDDRVLESLRMASVLGPSFSLTDLSTATGQSAMALSTTLGSARDAGLIGESGDRLIFRHELVRDAIYGDQPLSVRKGLHLEIGRALGRAGSPATQVATHFAIGASPGDTEAVEWLRTAARYALGRDPPTALSLLEKAREIAGGNHQRDEILVELLVALTWSGRPSEATRLAYELLERQSDPAVESAIRMSLSHTLFFQNRMAESAEQCELAVRLPRLPERTRADFLGRLATARLWAGDIDGAAAVAKEAEALGKRTGSDIAVGFGLTSRAWTAFLRGRMRDAIDAYSRAASLALRSDDQEARRATTMHTSLGFMLVEADRIDEAKQSMQTGRRLGDEIGRVWDLPLSHHFLGFARFVAGEWDDAVTDFAAGLAVAEDVGTQLGGVFPHSILALISLHRDDLAAAEEAVAAADRHAQTWGENGIEGYFRCCARARFLEARAASEEALSLLSSVWDRTTALGIMSARRVLGPDLVRLALSLDDDERARNVALGVHEAASIADVASVHGAALLCRGLVERDPQLLLDAVAAYEEGPRVIETGRAAEEAALSLVEVGRLQESESLVERATRAYERVGAVRDLSRLGSRLRKHGIRKGPRRRHRRAQTGWDALTPSEEIVISLLAEGLSNPQIAQRLFISRHTVETHVSHILAKLGASSRVELAAQWAGRGSTREEAETKGDSNS